MLFEAETDQTELFGLVVSTSGTDVLGGGGVGDRDYANEALRGRLSNVVLCPPGRPGWPLVG